jgi:acylphosphatase
LRWKKENAMPTLQLHITGRVQGVGYRASAQQQARKLGLSGFVRNQPDGSVYAEITGSQLQVEKMIRWCQNGPPLARVAAVKVTEVAEETGGEGFEVRY